jgi:signal peptidase I
MNQSPLRSVLQLAVGVFVAALVMHTWLVMGLVVSVTVAGSSMAPTLQGPHRMFHCDDCRFEFSVGLDQLLDDDRAICPRCGQPTAHRRDGFDERGDRLVVDRTAFVFRPPRRWEVVVFRSPTDANHLFVKRVVGLPGETISLRDDGIWINGQSVPKPGGGSYKIRIGDRDQCRLGPAEYFVLGDNSDISDDSRSWLIGPGVDANLLVGKPLGVR